MVANSVGDDYNGIDILYDILDMNFLNGFRFVITAPQIGQHDKRKSILCVVLAVFLQFAGGNVVARLAALLGELD